MKKVTAILFLVFLFVFPSVVYGAEPNVNSYNPTEPEVQLGKIKTMDIDESGTVYLNKHSIQGSLDKNGDVFIEAVKRPKVFAFDTEKDLTIYYFLDKDGDIFSTNLTKDKYLEDSQGTQVQLKLVSFLEGRNGVADGDGFKSNLVPEKFLPKTDLIKEDNYSNNMLFIIALIFGLSTITFITLYQIRKSKIKFEERR